MSVPSCVTDSRHPVISLGYLDTQAASVALNLGSRRLERLEEGGLRCSHKWEMRLWARRENGWGEGRCANRGNPDVDPAGRLPLAEAGSNVRIRAHNTVDPGFQRFRDHLLPERPEKAREFETAVGLLFFFLGFHVDPLSGQKGLGDAVDHLAHAPGSSVILVIECTVGSIDTGGKVGKLIDRSQRTRRELADSEVITVLTTAARRSDVSDAEVEKAERGDVVVLCREDVHELWAAARAGEGSTEVVRRLRQDLASSRVRRAEGRVG